MLSEIRVGESWKLAPPHYLWDNFVSTGAAYLWHAGIFLSIYYALFLRNLECLLSPLNVEWICHQTSPLANQCLFLKWKLCSGNFCVGDVEATGVHPEKKQLHLGKRSCSYCRYIGVFAVVTVLYWGGWSCNWVCTNLYNSRSKNARGIAISYLAKLK